MQLPPHCRGSSRLISYFQLWTFTFCCVITIQISSPQNAEWTGRCEKSSEYCLPGHSLGHLTWFCTEFLQRNCWHMGWISRQWRRLKTSWKVQRVVISSTKFSWKPVMSRVPQRSELSQVLSGIFVHDLNDEAEGTLFSSADDSKLRSYSHVRSRYYPATGWRNGLIGTSWSSTSNAKSCTWGWTIPDTNRRVNKYKCQGKSKQIYRYYNLII